MHQVCTESNPCGGYEGIISCQELTVNSRGKIIYQNKLESGIKQYRVFVSQNCRGCGDSGNQPRLDKLGVFMEKMGTEMQMETTEWSIPERIADHSLEMF